MSIKHKIILTYTKDLSVEIPDVQTLLLARERISKYKITLDIDLLTFSPPTLFCYSLTSRSFTC